jgi:lactoylglutathione lyase
LNDVSLNLVVIRAADPERAVRFYEIMGLVFEKHKHGSGAEHFASEGNVVFEIYPRTSESESTSATRLGFRVGDINATIARLVAAGVNVVSPVKDSPWGRRAVVDDFDGHRVELTESTAERNELTPAKI